MGKLKAYLKESPTVTKLLAYVAGIADGKFAGVVTDIQAKLLSTDDTCCEKVAAAIFGFLDTDKLNLAVLTETLAAHQDEIIAAIDDFLSPSLLQTSASPQVLCTTVYCTEAYCQEQYCPAFCGGTNSPWCLEMCLAGSAQHCR